LDIATLIAATTLIGASSNISSIYDFDYNFYDANSDIQTESGTKFFSPTIPEISLSGLTHIGNTGLIWNVASPFISKKYTRGINISSTLYYDYRINKNSRLRVSASFTSSAKESITPCVDGTGRKFHCYYGTQPSNPYFIYPFEDLRDLLYRQNRKIHLNQIGIQWLATF
jgi:hypothetical protein